MDVGRYGHGCVHAYTFVVDHRQWHYHGGIPLAILGFCKLGSSCRALWASAISWYAAITTSPFIGSRIDEWTAALLDLLLSRCCASRDDREKRRSKKQARWLACLLASFPLLIIHSPNQQR